MNEDELRQHVSEAAYQNIQHWLTEPKYLEYRDELQQMIADERWKELEDAFFKVIEFGTAGRRGTVGIGSNRLNRVTMGESAQALCEYAREADPEAPSKGIVITCDTRLSSQEFSRYCASVCAANGFKTYLFEDFRSTPELSFAVRHLGCKAGVVITASHNPPADNGFKPYWEDGAALVPPHDRGVLDKAAAVTKIRSVDFDEAVSDGRIVVIGQEVDEAYITAVLGESMGDSRGLTVVYSPLHGAGQRNTLPVLEQAGFAVQTVRDQMVPDGNFPTIENGRPNPQEPSANDLAVALMMARRADIAITNDPDADRLGVMVRQGDEVKYLTGNQTAALATDYVLRRLKARDDVRPTDYVVKTIVTTDLIDAIAAGYGVQCIGNLLVGFKYIGEVIRKNEGTGNRFLTGAEESFGFLKGDYARDKDGASSLMIAEYAAELKQDHKTLYDGLLDLYRRYGIYQERLDNIMYPGADGFTRMQEIMRAIREQTPREIEGRAVTAVLDYATLERTDLTSGTITPIDCRKGNVLVLEFDGEARRRVSIRPSGTEPKLKVYTQWYEPVVPDEDIEAHYGAVQQRLEGLGETLEGILLSE